MNLTILGRVLGHKKVQVPPTGDAVAPELLPKYEKFRFVAT